MRAVVSVSEELILGVNCKSIKQTSWKGEVSTVYSAKIGNSTFYRKSFDDLKNDIKNYHFETAEDVSFKTKAIQAFGTIGD